MRKTLEKPRHQMVCLVPMMIAPTEEGLYQLPTWTTHLPSTRLYIVYFCFRSS